MVPGLNLWPITRRCRSNARLDGKTVVITGGNCGIGMEIVRDLYWRGARMVLLCRDMDKARCAIDEIEESPPRRATGQSTIGAGELVAHPLDLASFESIRECARKVLESETKINIFINNAGVFGPLERLSHDGIEIHFQVNHLGSALITLLLLPRIRESGPGCRIVNVASVMHIVGSIDFEDVNLEKSYNVMRAYAQSKLAFMLFTQNLMAYIKEEKIENINVYMLHPGLVKTEIIRHMNTTICSCCHIFVKLLNLLSIVKNAKQGAQTAIHCAVSEEIANETGLYYSACKVANVSSKVSNPIYIERCWQLTCKFLDLDPYLSLDELSKQAAQKR